MEVPGSINQSSIKPLEVIHPGEFSHVFLVELQQCENVFRKSDENRMYQSKLLFCGLPADSIEVSCFCSLSIWVIKH